MIERDGQGARLVLRNASYLIAGQGASGVAQFLRSAMIARYLGPAEYGAWGFAFAFVNLFAAAADFGLSTVAVRDVARGTDEGRYYGTALRLKLVLNLALLLLMLAVQPLVDRDGQARWLIYIMGAQMFLASLSLLAQTVFRARERMAIEAAINTSVSVLSLVLAAVLVAAGYGVEAIAASFLVCTTLGLAVSTATCRHWFLRGDLHWDPHLAQRLLRDCWPIAVAMVFTAVYYFYDRVLMGVLGQHTEIGWYTAAYAPALWLSGIVGMVRAAFLPAQSRALSEGANAAPLLRFYGRVTLILGLPAGAGGIFLSGPLIEAVYGRSYGPATFAMQVLLVTVSAMFISSFLGSNLLASGRQKPYLRAVGLGAVLNVALNSFMVPLWSLNGAAVATLLAESFVACLFARECRQWLGLADFRHMLVRPAIATAVFAAALALTAPLMHFVLAAAVAGMALVVATFTLRVLEDRQSLEPDTPAVNAAA